MQLFNSGLSAVVFGGSKGIGAEIVKQLAAEGVTVHFCGRDPDAVFKLEKEINQSSDKHRGSVFGKAVNINNQDDVQSWLETIGEFNLAYSCVSALSGDWAASLEMDIHGTVNVTEAVMPYLLKSENAAFTWIGSKASSFVTPGFEAYGATKAAMVHYIKTTAAKYTPQGVRINIVSPGDTFVANGFWDNIKQHAPEVYHSAIAANPMKRLAMANEIANVALFISSPKASFVSGANWYVDGGATTHITL